MGKDARGAAKAERDWLRREAERRARKAAAAADQSARAKRRMVDSEMARGESNRDGR
jgi:hypothetical protein